MHTFSSVNKNTLHSHKFRLIQSPNGPLWYLKNTLRGAKMIHTFQNIRSSILQKALYLFNSYPNQIWSWSAIKNNLNSIKILKFREFLQSLLAIKIKIDWIHFSNKSQNKQSKLYTFCTFKIKLFSSQNREFERLKFIRLSLFKPKDRWKESNRFLPKSVK